MRWLIHYWFLWLLCAELNLHLCACEQMNVWMSCFYVSYVNVRALSCPHRSFSLSSLVNVHPSPHLTGDLDGHWWDYASWHSSEASSMSLVRHVEPCLDTPFSPPLCLSPPPPSFLPVFCHFMFPSLYLHLCMLFFLFSFCFLSHTCREQSKGKKKNYWAGIYVRADTHLIWEAKENGALWGTLIWRGLGMVWTSG